MGRSVIADESLQTTLDVLVRIPDCVVGLAIGQNTAQKDFLCHLANTPQKPAQDALDAGDASRPPEKQKRSKAPSFDDVDERLVVQHAKQVIRTLPGGITILGVFVMFPGESLPSTSLSKAKQILISIFKMLSRQLHFRNCVDVSEKVVLHVNPLSQRITAKTFDLSNVQNSAKPADFRYQKGGLGWHGFECRFALDLSIDVVREDLNLPLLKQIHRNLLPFYSAIESSVVLVDGRLFKPDDVLDGGKEVVKGKAKDRKATNAGHVDHSAEIFMESFLLNETEDNVVRDCAAKMHLKGTLKSRAYVHSKATAEEAVHAIKQDVIRSLISRIEIHCEDILLIEEEQQDPCIVHEPPRRVFAALPDGKIKVSDYLFPGDKPKDSVEVYAELLSLILTEDDIEFDCERVAESHDLSPNSSDVAKSVASSYESSSVATCSRSGNVLVAALSIAVLVLATSLAHMYLSRNE